MEKKKIGILGTGMVGRAHAARLLELGHDVVMGTQDVEKTLAESKPDQMGNPAFSEWYKDHAGIKLMIFKEAIAHGDVVFGVLKGEVALDVLKGFAKDFTGKVLVDVANPLDFSKGMPPSLSVCNIDSLGEQIQKALPETKVVKAFNTTNAFLQVNPAQLGGGDHTLFICGEDVEAKAIVMSIAQAYGWKDIIDLGGIENARGMEMLLPIWLRLWGALKTPMFNYRVVR